MFQHRSPSVSSDRSDRTEAGFLPPEAFEPPSPHSSSHMTTTTCSTSVRDRENGREVSQQKNGIIVIDEEGEERNSQPLPEETPPPGSCQPPPMIEPHENHIEKAQPENDNNGEKQAVVVKRPPPNGFFLWARECHRFSRRYKLNFQDHVELRKKLGQKWRTMSKEEQAPWLKKAREMMREYQNAGNTYARRRKKKVVDPPRMNRAAAIERVADEDMPIGEYLRLNSRLFVPSPAVPLVVADQQAENKSIENWLNIPSIGDGEQIMLTSDPNPLANFADQQSSNNSLASFVENAIQAKTEANKNWEERAEQQEHHGMDYSQLPDEPVHHQLQQQQSRQQQFSQIPSTSSSSASSSSHQLENCQHLLDEYFSGQILTVEELHEKLRGVGVKISPWKLNTYLIKMKMGLNKIQSSAPKGVGDLKVMRPVDCFLIGNGKEWRKFMETSYEKRKDIVYVRCINCTKIQKNVDKLDEAYSMVGRAKIQGGVLTGDSVPIWHFAECRGEERTHKQPKSTSEPAELIVMDEEEQREEEKGEEEEEDDVIVIDGEERQGRMMEGEEKGKKKRTIGEELQQGLEEIASEMALELIQSGDNIILSPRNMVRGAAISQRSLSVVPMEQNHVLVNGFLGNILRESVRWSIPSDGIQQLLYALRGKCFQFFYLSAAEIGAKTGGEGGGWMLRTN